MAYNFKMKKCVDLPTGKYSNPLVTFEDESIRDNYVILTGKMTCSKKKNELRLRVHPFSKDFSLHEDGKLYVKIETSVKALVYDASKYCIDTFVSDTEGPHLNALICFVSNPERNNYTMSSSSFIVYFSLLSAFFWLNVMCYDIWWTFREQQIVVLIRTNSDPLRGELNILHPDGLQDSKDQKRNQNATGQRELHTRPRQKGHSKFTKSNFIGAKSLKLKCSRFTLYVKLFTVMGINWILEVVSSFYPEANVFWQFSDAYNVLVGLIIFIIFVCKKKTWRMIKKRFVLLYNCLRRDNSGGGLTSMAS
ncbi:hypothetical protein HF086_015388 [Spodoptera exigua]|uniref:Uncharacterized protein n=1 Tax=Spodoptera exigua TaxID=7107 RepID=A0A922M0A0_SPOEX|nr:hypothetical protein HF086_015388 [Spodoptera exigua]